MGTTSNLRLTTQVTGALNWDLPIEANWSLLDSELGASTSVALTNVPVTLSSAQYQCLFINFTGVLTGNVTISFPAFGRFYVLTNSTTGNFTITCQVTGAPGTTMTLRGSVPRLCVSDGTNFKLVASDSMRSIIVNEQVFTGSGTYTPTSGMVYCTIECVGGGGGGGAAGGFASFGGSGGGGGSGSYSRAIKSSSQVGASQAVTIGGAGAAGTGAGGNGGNGGVTSVGALCVANGGSGGVGQTGAILAPAGGAGGTAGTGDVTAVGAPGGGGSYFNNNTSSVPGGAGGASYFGGGGAGGTANTAGTAGSNYGSGGGGGCTQNSAGNNKGGGAGSAGIVVVTEYIIVTFP